MPDHQNDASNVIPYPGHTAEMAEQPRDEMRDYEGRGLLAGKRALITGGDSGIGRAVAVAFAKEGADVAIAYLEEHDDAKHTTKLVAGGRPALACGCPATSPTPTTAARVVDRTVERARRAGHPRQQRGLPGAGRRRSSELTDEQWQRTFARQHPQLLLRHQGGRCRTWGTAARSSTPASINGLRGNKSLIDYSATKGAVLALTYSLAQALMERRIRVNCGRAGPGLDAADSRHHGRGAGRVVRRAHPHGARRTARRDRAVLRVLRRRAAFVLLQRRGARPDRRRDAPWLRMPAVTKQGERLQRFRAVV